MDTTPVFPIVDSPNRQITISISIAPEGFYCTAQLDECNFACMTVQPTLELALNSVLSHLRRYASILQTESDSVTSGNHLDPTNVSRATRENASNQVLVD